MIRNLRYFCQRVLPIVYDDSLSFQELLYKVICKINEIIPAVNITDERIVNEVTKILQEMIDDGTIEDLINRELFNDLNNKIDSNYNVLDTKIDNNYNTLNSRITNNYNTLNDRITTANANIAANAVDIVRIKRRPSIVEGNVKLNSFIESDFHMQGGCYIGAGRVVIYYSSYTSNRGVLRCYDIENHILLWGYRMEAYHGNTICIRENKLYITCCQTYNQPSVLLNTVAVVNLNNPGQIESVKTLPVSGVFSLVYNPSNDKFYGITARGYEPGIADKVTIFNADLTAVEGEFVLDDHPAVAYKHNTQGLSCCYNNVLYLLDYSDNTIIGYDLQGRVVYFGLSQDYHNGYRRIGEIEFLTNDEYRFYMGSVFTDAGERYYTYGTISEVGVVIDIYPTKILPYNYVNDSREGEYCHAYVAFNQVLNPATAAVFQTLADAVNLAKNCNCWLSVSIGSDRSDFKGFHGVYNDFNGRLLCNNIKCTGLNLYGCNVRIADLNITEAADTEIPYGSSNINAALYLRNCNASLLNINGSVSNHVFLGDGDYKLFNGDVNLVANFATVEVFNSSMLKSKDIQLGAVVNDRS